MAVLVVGSPEPSLAAELGQRKTLLHLPTGPQRAAFLDRHADDVTVILSCGRPGVDSGLMAQLPNLEAIANFGAGVDAIDLDAARGRGIAVSNTPDVLTDTVADTALGLILDTMRGFSAADRYIRAGRWPVEGPLPYTRDLSGSRVGILGLGRIGSAIATRLLGFDCAVAYHNRREIPDSPYRYAACTWLRTPQASVCRDGRVLRSRRSTKAARNCMRGSTTANRLRPICWSARTARVRGSAKVPA